MHNLEIIEYFPKGVRPKDIFYSQDNTVNLSIASCGKEKGSSAFAIFNRWLEGK